MSNVKCGNGHDLPDSYWGEDCPVCNFQQKVLELDDYRPIWVHEQVWCASCGNSHVAVYKVNTAFPLECPACHKLDCHGITRANGFDPKEDPDDMRTWER